MKKLTGILVVLFLMICSLAAAAGPEFRSNVSASKWLQVKDMAGLFFQRRFPRAPDRVAQKRE